MKMKYKCTVEIEMPFPDSDFKSTETAKAAIEELIDGTIYDAVFAEMCSDQDTLVVTRELLEYVEEEDAQGCCNEEMQHTEEADCE